MSIMTRIADVDHALYTLDAFLRRRDYAQRSREGIAVHIRATGELSGSVPEFLDAEDLAVATEVFVDALPPVSECSPDWDAEPGYWAHDDVRVVGTDSMGADIFSDELQDEPTDEFEEWTGPDGITRILRKVTDAEVYGTMPLLAGGSPDESDDESDECRPTEPGIESDPDPDEETILDPQTGEEFPRSLFGLPPISGGSPGADHAELFEPTEADRLDYARWSDMLDRTRAFYDLHGDDPDRPMGRGFIPA